MPSYVVMNDLEVNRFRGWTGPLGRSVNRLAKETEFRAKAMANVRTGQLKSSIYTDRGRWARGIQFTVGTKVPYALWIEEGTNPHEIRARKAPYLVFFWPRVGRVVHFKKVNHPGNRPYRYLQRALERAMRMWQRGG